MRLTDEQKELNKVVREGRRLGEKFRRAEFWYDAPQRAAEVRQEAALREVVRWEPRMYAILNRGLVEVPVWHNHYRAKNWCAIIEADPIAIGGLKREWLSRARGRDIFYVIPGRLHVSDVLEFAADHVTYEGKTNANRFIGMVLELTATRLALKPFPNVISAFLAQQKMREEAALAQQKGVAL